LCQYVRLDQAAHADYGEPLAVRLARALQTAEPSSAHGFAA
jgi:hypothetical protein